MVIYSFGELDPGTYFLMVWVDPSATLKLPRYQTVAL